MCHSAWGGQDGKTGLVSHCSLIDKHRIRDGSDKDIVRLSWGFSSGTEELRFSTVWLSLGCSTTYSCATPNTSPIFVFSPIIIQTRASRVPLTDLAPLLSTMRAVDVSRRRVNGESIGYLPAVRSGIEAVRLVIFSTYKTQSVPPEFSPLASK